jgi:hypothetical protein
LVAEDRGMTPELCQQLMLAILDDSARGYVDVWEAFLQDRQELVTICGPPTTAAPPAPRRSGQPQPMALGGARQRPGELPGRPPIQA